jgi:endonuclease III
VYKDNADVPEILSELESHYGSQEPCWPTDPYDFLIWWHCGYPASDANCARGWEELKQQVGSEPRRILDAGVAKLARALRPGGMVPELRAQRLLQIAARVQDEYGSDLRAGLVGPISGVRRALKRFPNIGDPGADRILLFGGISAVAAIPSNCPHVLVRIVRGSEHESYAVTYREAQESLEEAIPPTLDARSRAYLLLKRHVQEVCKRSNPKCGQCPIRSGCAFAAGKLRGRTNPT